LITGAASGSASISRCSTVRLPEGFGGVVRPCNSPNRSGRTNLGWHRFDARLNNAVAKSCTAGFRVVLLARYALLQLQCCPVMSQRAFGCPDPTFQFVAHAQIGLMHQLVIQLMHDLLKVADVCLDRTLYSWGSGHCNARCIFRYRARSRLENWKAPITNANPAKTACGIRNSIPGAKCRAICDVGWNISAFFMYVTKPQPLSVTTRSQATATEGATHRISAGL
jgi:hypothetical protein